MDNFIVDRGADYPWKRRDSFGGPIAFEVGDGAMRLQLLGGNLIELTGSYPGTDAGSESGQDFSYNPAGSTNALDLGPAPIRDCHGDDNPCVLFSQ
jgi:hypothetical protein